MKMECSNKIDVWGGIECSINRVGEHFMDQLQLSGHYQRSGDIDRIAKLGVKAVRYPVLWEKYAPDTLEDIDWSFAHQQLETIRQTGMEPIVGLVHHGSGPRYASFLDNSFANGLAEYAKKLATQFSWVEYYTPVNEPLTTARFCGLYGLWYPHGKTNYTFLKVLLSECKGTVLAMQAIRKINPHAKLVQTEDLGKTHSTPLLNYQAKFENERRWLSFDLLSGKVTPKHPLYNFILKAGIGKEDLQFLVDNPCPPEIMGINHYITSERFLDHRIKHYPKHTRGGNGRHKYADVEAVRLNNQAIAGPEQLLMEAWKRYGLPIAITEVHLHCTREEQLRWFNHVWKAAHGAKERGADIRAVTAWAIFGSFDWCSLLTKPKGIYEAGLYDIRSLEPRATALTALVHTIASGGKYYHPVLDECGWWERECRVQYFANEKKIPTSTLMKAKNTQPLLIIGKTGTLGKAMSRICTLRGIHHVSVGRNDVDIMDIADMERLMKQHNPWGVINAVGYVRVDDAEGDAEACYAINTQAAEHMACIGHKLGVQFMTFSSDLVFDGKKTNPYLESDAVGPLNIYGKSKAIAEEKVMAGNSNALIIRTSAFFGPWDEHNFVYHVLNSLKQEREMPVADDLYISPTYVPDLVNTTLDLLIDEATGIWNISNHGTATWSTLANEIAARSGMQPTNLKAMPVSQLGLKATRPAYSVLTTERGFKLPSLDNALERYFKEQEMFA